eukprot:209463_1
MEYDEFLTLLDKLYETGDFQYGLYKIDDLKNNLELTTDFKENIYNNDLKLDEKEYEPYEIKHFELDDDSSDNASEQSLNERDSALDWSSEYANITKEFHTIMKIMYKNIYYGDLRHFNPSDQFTILKKENKEGIISTLNLETMYECIRTFRVMQAHHFVCALKEQNIFDELKDLVQYKQEIFNYMLQHGFDGTKLERSKKKHFIANIVQYVVNYIMEQTIEEWRMQERKKQKQMGETEESDEDEDEDSDAFETSEQVRKREEKQVQIKNRRKKEEEREKRERKRIENELKVPFSKLYSVLMMVVKKKYSARDNRQSSKFNSILNAFYDLLSITKKRFYEIVIKEKCEKDEFASLNEDAKQWILGKITQNKVFIGIETKKKAFMVIFNIKNLEELESQIKKIEGMVRSNFIRYTSKILRKTVLLISELKLYEEKYVKEQNKNRVEEIFKKAELKLQMNSVKKLAAIWYHGINEYHEIALNDPLKLDHIVSLISYTDETDLCTSFRTTYRKIKANESITSQKERHSKFGNMGKLLYQSFVFYANKHSQITSLYHGMSFPLLFTTLYCSFDAPTSTTTAVSVAQNFGNDMGIVVEFESCESCKFIRTLNMELFSCFNEEEHLIFETRLHIKKIFLPRERAWINAKLMNTLSLYDLLSHGNVVYNKKLLTETRQNKLCKLLKSIMKKQNSKSSYVNSLISALTTQKDTVWLNIQQIQQLNDNLKPMFISNDGELGEFISYLQTNHNVVISPVYTTNWEMTEHTFSLVKRAKEKYENIVIAGSTVTCKLSQNKTITFQPQLHQIEGAFDIKMKLMDVYEKKQIKIHFNLSCQQLNDYFTLLHPQIMDLGFNNSIDIMLPTIDEKEESLKSINIEMSVMLHNFRDFDIDYSDVNLKESMLMTQNMNHSSASYEIADILSVFYGFSNSVFSVLDSISDVLFFM